MIFTPCSTKLPEISRCFIWKKYRGLFKITQLAFPIQKIGSLLKLTVLCTQTDLVTVSPIYSNPARRGFAKQLELKLTISMDPKIKQYCALQIFGWFKSVTITGTTMIKDCCYDICTTWRCPKLYIREFLSLLAEYRWFFNQPNWTTCDTGQHRYEHSRVQRSTFKSSGINGSRHALASKSRPALSPC